LDYAFIDRHTLRFMLDGSGNWQSTRYEAFESDAGLVLVAHLIPGPPIHGMTLTLDLREGLVTWVETYYGNTAYPREPLRDIRFGVILAAGITPPKYKRHGYTTELVGYSYTWDYSYSMTSQHIYSSPWSYSWSIMMPSGMPGITWSSPCVYIKIREGIYIFSWIEERAQAMCGTFLFNTKTMHDCGTACGISHSEDIFTFNTFGAQARSAGKLDLNEIYSISCQ